MTPAPEPETIDALAMRITTESPDCVAGWGRDEALSDLATATLLRGARVKELEEALRFCRGNLTPDEREAREIIDAALTPRAAGDADATNPKEK